MALILRGIDHTPGWVRRTTGTTSLAHRNVVYWTGEGYLKEGVRISAGGWVVELQAPAQRFTSQELVVTKHPYDLKKLQEILNPKSKNWERITDEEARTALGAETCEQVLKKAQEPRPTSN